MGQGVKSGVVDLPITDATVTLPDGSTWKAKAIEVEPDSVFWSRTLHWSVWRLKRADGSIAYVGVDWANATLVEDDD